MTTGIVSRLVLAVIATAFAALGGCNPSPYNPDRATAAYPFNLHGVPAEINNVTVQVPRSVQIQVFREGASLEIVNATARSYEDFDLWINQRYVKHLESLPAGETLRISLWDFYDERGEALVAGGFFRTEKETPVRLVEMQLDDETPLIGLIAIRRLIDDEDR
jgi:hypothetical protein